MSNCRRDSAINTSDPASQLQEQLRIWGGLSGYLPQHDIDAMYTAEFGAPTQQDSNGFLFLFLGLQEDILELQEELLEITAGGVDAMTIAPCLYGRLNVIMKERVEAIAHGKPLIVKGYPHIYPGRMMLRWARDYDAVVPSLYDRLEYLLAVEAQRSSSDASSAVAPTSVPERSSTANSGSQSVAAVAGNRRQRRAWIRSSASLSSRK